MAASEAILLKIKHLQALAQSPNENEATNARLLIEKLIAKYEVTEAELKGLEEKKPLYGEDNKLFQTVGLVGWKQQLALGVAKHFYSRIVQEEHVPAEGEHEFVYYVYGEPEDEANTKLAFYLFADKVNKLIEKNCSNRGKVYVSSYGEGVTEAIKNNIQWEGIDLPGIKSPAHVTKEATAELPNGPANLAKPREEKEKPVEASVDVNKQSSIQDVQAYFRGLEDGRDFSLKEILELEFDGDTKQLEEGDDDDGWVPISPIFRRS